MWTCRCGEENERQFHWCWKCGLPRPEEQVAGAPAPTPDEPGPGVHEPPRLRPRHAPKAFALWCVATYAVVYAISPFAGEDLQWRFIITHPASALILAWLMTKGHNVPWRDVLPVAAPGAGATIATIILSLGLSIVVTWLFDVLYLIPDLARVFDAWPWNPLDRDLAGAGLLKDVLAAGIAAPLTEEAVFRGVILSALLAGWPTRRAIMVTALLFAVPHIHVVSIVTALVLGVLAGWQRVVFGTLWLPVLAHAVFNAHALAWHHSPWMPDWPTSVWLLVGVLMTMLGLDLSLRRRPLPDVRDPA